MICTLIEAMEAKKTCKVTYKAIMRNRAKTYYIDPLKIFSYKDTIYLHAQIASSPGEDFVEPDFDPLLAIHRFKKVEMTERDFECPKDYDFEKVFNRNFGVMKDEPFVVEIEFTGWAARYVEERIWSPDQKISKIDDDKICLTFTASSEPELIGWLLYFGEEARLIKPKGLVGDLAEKTKKMAALYS